MIGKNKKVKDFEEFKKRYASNILEENWSLSEYYPEIADSFQIERVKLKDIINNLLPFCKKDYYLDGIYFDTNRAVANDSQSLGVCYYENSINTKPFFISSNICRILMKFLNVVEDSIISFKIIYGGFKLTINDKIVFNIKDVKYPDYMRVISENGDIIKTFNKKLLLKSIGKNSKEICWGSEMVLVFPVEIMDNIFIGLRVKDLKKVLRSIKEDEIKLKTKSYCSASIINDNYALMPLRLPKDYQSVGC
jgi:DNA polymerase III sliding clamp (beta) subunit (PCNA family)